MLSVKKGAAVTDGTFTAGVVPGGLNETSQIKILICYVVGTLELPLSGEGLLEALSGKGYANYFECASALSELLETGHIELDGGGYQITPSGREIAALLADDVALTVRERVLDYALVIAKRESVKQSCRATIARSSKGWKLRGAVNDSSGEMFALEAVFPTMDAAQAARDSFLDNAENIVLINFDLLRGD